MLSGLFPRKLTSQPSINACSAAVMPDRSAHDYLKALKQASCALLSGRTSLGTRMVISICVFTLAAPTTLLVWQAGAQSAAASILVVDFAAGTAQRGALFVVDPVTGQRALLSDFGNPAQGPLGAQPHSATVEVSGAILVADPDAGPDGGALFRVDAATGQRTLLSDFGNPAQGPVGRPNSTAIETSGAILAIDAKGGANNLGLLFRVDPTSGDRTILHDFSTYVDGTGNTPHGVIVEDSGAILAIDLNAGSDKDGALFRIDAVTGQRSLVSDFGDAAQGPLGVDPIDLRNESGAAVLVIDHAAGIAGLGALFRVDRATGQRTVLSDFGDPAQGPLGSHPSDLARESTGAILVIDNSAHGVLFRVDPATGHRTVVSDFGNPTQGPLGVAPFGVAVATAQDTTPPTLSLPGTITASATSPAGAVVTYTVSATDPDNPPSQLTISCAPVSGTTFAIGTTSVNCQASDPASNSTTGSFQVVVNGASPQTTDLINTVDSFLLPHGLQMSLTAKLENALSALNAGDIGTACSDLTAFINQVTAQSGKKLTVAQANQLISAATQIKAVLGC